MLGVVIAVFPVPEVPPSTQRAWMGLLMDADHASCLKAAKELGREGTPGGRPFQIGMLLTRAEEIWRDEYALTAQTHAEPDRAALVDVVPATEEEKRAILGRYWDEVGTDRASRARLQHAARTGDTDARIDAARDLAAQQIEDGPVTAQERSARPPSVSDPAAVTTTACGAPAGSETVLRADGVRVCPNCGSPVLEGCAPAFTRARQEEGA